MVLGQGAAIRKKHLNIGLLLWRRMGVSTDMGTNAMFAQRYVLCCLRWRCTSRRPASHLGFIRFFQVCFPESLRVRSTGTRCTQQIACPTDPFWAKIQQPHPEAFSGELSKHFQVYAWHTQCNFLLARQFVRHTREARTVHLVALSVRSRTIARRGADTS